jgi:hypothetical protein
MARQNKKGRLKGVFGVLLVLQHTPADAQHHRPVAGYQCGEGDLVAAGDEIIKQFAVGPLPAVSVGRKSVDVTQERAKRCRGHGRSSPISDSLPCSSRLNGSHPYSF